MNSLPVRVAVLTTVITGLLLGIVALLVIEASRSQITRQAREDSRTEYICTGGVCVELHEDRALDIRGFFPQYSVASLQPDLSLWPLSDPFKTRYLTYGTFHTEPRDWVVHEAQRQLNATVLMILGAAATLTALTGAVVHSAAARVLRPMEEMREEVAEINEHDLTRRVPVPDADNEITRLAATMNETLDRVHKAVEDTRRFVADASHELRSPLAALRAELEIALSHPSLSDWPTVVKAALEDTERLQELTTDLLLLARLDSDSATRQDEVDLTAVVQREMLRRRLSTVDVVADIDPRPVHVAGRRAQLSRLLGNLLDNAERHASSTVTVRLRGGPDAVLEVTDDGPGIPQPDRERVFDRFTRLDDARTRDAGGAGLGLAIARRIAARHHGTLTATDSEDFKGIRFVATIPTGDPTPRPATVPVQRTGDEVWVYVNGEIMPTHGFTPEPREPVQHELDPRLIFGEHLPVITH